MNMKKRIANFFLAPLLFFMTFGTSSAAFIDIWKGTSGGGCNKSATGCSLCDGVKVVVNSINILTELAVVLAVGMTVYGAIVLMISGGSEERVKKGRGSITSAIIGLIIVLAGWLIINTVLHLITGNIDFPWADIQCYNTT